MTWIWKTLIQFQKWRYKVIFIQFGNWVRLAKQRNHFFQSILTIKNYKNAQKSCFKTLFGLRYLERERVEEETFSVVKLGLELDPVQPEAVEEGRQAFHHAQDADRQERPEGEDGEHDEGAVPGKVPVVTISAARWPNVPVVFSRFLRFYFISASNEKHWL